MPINRVQLICGRQLPLNTQKLDDCYVEADRLGGGWGGGREGGGLGLDATKRWKRRKR